MDRQRLNQSRGNYDSRRSYPKEEKHGWSERRLAAFGLLASLIIVAVKLYWIYRDNLVKLILEQRLISYEVITADGQVMLHYAWKTVVRFSTFWFPLLCGCLATYFTWLMVYLDSSVPGVQPPSPLSPQKYKSQSGHTFHLNYIFAVMIGVLVFSYMYWRGVSLQF